MNLRLCAIYSGLSAICIGLAPQAYAAKEKKTHKVTKAFPESKEIKFRLKPGAEKKICLSCHSDLQEKLKKPFVHTRDYKNGVYGLPQPPHDELPEATYG